MYDALLCMRCTDGLAYYPLGIAPLWVVADLRSVLASRYRVPVVDLALTDGQL
jgi:hypothetical protein